ncbi:T9SS C-terminal target domain-containing protein [Chitinophaga lutea]|uniref:T9SS C-terminal target domain-containing protein n=1 Tax=Chitinophaga lutea TaxID=2488634 RepID=A0A3N4PVL5_9BACT|nr:S8 family serine peptidase [Chitinophaga lutea]RPE09131.1 T9SS C-terminal target domain-containing protein [Chitinophaga lutea]
MRVTLSPRLFFTVSCIVAILATCRLSAQSDPFVQRYAAPVPDTQEHRKKPDFFLVRFPAFPGETNLNRLQRKRSLSPLYHIVGTIPADTSVKSWPANGNWKATEAVLDKLDQLAARDSITVLANAAPPPARLLRWETPDKLAFLRVAKKDWAAFISHPSVIIVDLQRRPRTETVLNTANYTLNRITTLQARLPALRGENMRVSLKETLYDTADIDLVQRHIPTANEPAETAVHATIMATLMAGAGNSGTSGKGVAPAARIASADFLRLLPDAPGYFAQYNLHAQNHSYGTGLENYYGLEAVAYDEQVHAADTLVHVFSSGNSGAATPTAGLYTGLAGFANLTGTFKQAKNVIVVGGTDSINNVPALSSGGPAYDGRIKPELVAFGEEGTSGAAALTTGAVLLLQESYRSTHGQMPPAALIKAVLVNSADDTGAPGPGYRTGYGALNAWEAVQTIREQRFSSGAVTNGSTYTQTIPVPAGQQLLKVTMSYADVPAAANAAKALVNDLDLEITDAAGNRYAPWVLSTAPFRDSLLKAARTGRDSLNNTEQVGIMLPAAGNYTVTVHGRAVAAGSQRFHLAWQMVPAAHFDWQYPAANEILPAREPVTLRWRSTFGGTGRLLYSLDKGANWRLINGNADLAQGYATWETPDVFGEALLKMEQGATAVVSAPFLVSPRIQVQTGFNCTDSALLYWNRIPGARYYQVYALNGAYFSPFSQTADTVLILKKNAALPQVFAVSPVAAMEGARSRGIDYTKQGLDCYIRTFTADLDNNGQVQLRLTLGSTWQLKSITWERQGAALAQTPVSGGLIYQHNDAAPPQGIVYYRVKLETANGQFIYSAAIPVRVLTESAYLLFPNPAAATLQILAARLEAQEIRIMDVQGRVVRTLLLQNLLQPVSLQGLSAGTYWCIIYRNGEKIFTGQFVKL